MKKFFISTTMFLFFSMSVFAVIFCNGTPCPYQGNCDNGSDGTSSISSVYGTMNTIVAIGAGEFLGSHSNYQLFLKNYELTGLYGFDYGNLNKFIVDAIIEMENAYDYFEFLIMIAEITPYDQVYVDKLKNFDYDLFQGQNNLNNQVFNKARQFLITCDITGAYKSILTDIKGIVVSLYLLKDSIDRNVIPEVSIVWKLNQKYSDTLFFGQYLAMVCKDI